MSFLDPYNQYTCGYFKNTDDLSIAQEQKLDLICKKLQLTKNDRVLDIGCGWGGFAKFAAERYGCQVTGLTISGEQAKYAREFTEGLPVEIVEADYREWPKSGNTYSKITTIGMIEHVGYKNYKTFFEAVNTLLEREGLYLLHTIGSYASVMHGDPWSHKYIFKNGMLPSVEQIGKYTQDMFVMEDWHNFGGYYANTLRAWDDNFKRNWDSIKDSYNERFYRMWRYYLNSFAGAFAARRIHLWQIVFSHGSDPDIYQSIR